MKTRGYREGGIKQEQSKRGVTVDERRLNKKKNNITVCMSKRASDDFF